MIRPQNAKKHQNGYNKNQNSSKIRIQIKTSEVRNILDSQDDGNSKCDAQYVNQFQKPPR
jgi:hypothetical protein